MGGGGGYPETTTQNQNVNHEPWGPAEPLLMQGLSGIQAQYGDPSSPEFGQTALDRITPFSDHTLASMDLTTEAVGDATGGIDAARMGTMSALGSGISGLGNAFDVNGVASSYIGSNGQIAPGMTNDDIAAMGAFANPAAISSDLVNSILDPVQGRVNQMAAQAGRVGSGMHDYALAKGMTDAIAPVMYESQNDALTRGTDIYNAAADRNSGLASNAMGLAADRYGTDADIIANMSGIQTDLLQGDLTGAAAMAQVGGEIEALDDAIRNASFDQLNEFLQRSGYIAGMGGSTASNVGVTDSGGGGFGLANGLGALIAGGSIASSLFG